ncbi:hypothetical protein D3C81_1332590 [compost metagenome]
MQFHRCLALRRDQREACALGTQHKVAGAHIGAVLQAETQHLATCRRPDEMLFEERCERIVGIDHRHAVFRQRRVDGAFGGGHAQQAAHALKVRSGDVVDQRIMRVRDVGQVRNVTELAGAHFVHGVVGIFRRVDHRQRQADFIVAVARRGVDLTAFHLRGMLQDRQQQALDAGLAVAAGDGEHAGGAVVLHRRCNLCQRQFGIGDHDLRHVLRLQRVHQQGTGATGDGVGGKHVAVETLTAQRDIQTAGAERAGVIADGVDGHVFTVDLATGPMGDQRQRSALHERTSWPTAARANSARDATSVSSKGCLIPAIS